ncbi:hypothetical protein PTSG_11530 [Salpingoeca rosetta]|uniref:XPG N-terminal domain-containing protein n=1 Tax=Salpingoeca rosetta (strain ATCC 50818 / BSB-021) TaxID=946362 RepID=F2TVE5_SALR5|nr:uncharacterized protein PTSG_11530 [Salpingoeca rosetta]EGD72041.1 hypothetical protein PTSG_11530 [Salpingoeca rosetta]|eukprot:XP_004998613.1 hypothetical protein PTSG_11530 [Salpingoeca rosetta]
MGIRGLRAVVEEEDDGCGGGVEVVKAYEDVVFHNSSNSSSRVAECDGKQAQEEVSKQVGKDETATSATSSNTTTTNSNTNTSNTTSNSVVVDGGGLLYRLVQEATSMAEHPHAQWDGLKYAVLQCMDLLTKCFDSVTVVLDGPAPLTKQDTLQDRQLQLAKHARAMCSSLAREDKGTRHHHHQQQRQSHRAPRHKQQKHQHQHRRHQHRKQGKRAARKHATAGQGARPSNHGHSQRGADGPCILPPGLWHFFTSILLDRFGSKVAVIMATHEGDALVAARGTAESVRLRDGKRL